MPTIEASVALGCVFWRNLGLVETRVLRVLQLGFSETLVIVDGAISDQLDLGNSRDRLQVGMKDRFGVLLSLVVAVTIGITLWVKSLDGEGIDTSIPSQVLFCLHWTYLCELVLLLGREINISEEEYIVLPGAQLSETTRGTQRQQRKPCTITVQSP